MSNLLIIGGSVSKSSIITFSTVEDYTDIQNHDTCLVMFWDSRKYGCASILFSDDSADYFDAIDATPGYHHFIMLKCKDLSTSDKLVFKSYQNVLGTHRLMLSSNYQCRFAKVCQDAEELRLPHFLTEDQNDFENIKIVYPIEGTKTDTDE